MPNISKKSFHILNPRLDPNFKAIFTQNTKASKIALKSFLSAASGLNTMRLALSLPCWKSAMSVSFQICPMVLR